MTCISGANEVIITYIRSLCERLPLVPKSQLTKSAAGAKTGTRRGEAVVSYPKSLAILVAKRLGGHACSYRSLLDLLLIPVNHAQ